VKSRKKKRKKIMTSGAKKPVTVPSREASLFPKASIRKK